MKFSLKYAYFTIQLPSEVFYNIFVELHWWCLLAACVVLWLEVRLTSTTCGDDSPPSPSLASQPIGARVKLSICSFKKRCRWLSLTEYFSLFTNKYSKLWCIIIRVILFISLYREHKRIQGVKNLWLVIIVLDTPILSREEREMEFRWWRRIQGQNIHKKQNSGTENSPRKNYPDIT